MRDKLPEHRKALKNYTILIKKIIHMDLKFDIHLFKRRKRLNHLNICT